MVLPWIFYIEELDDEDMGDLEYIESKVLAGDYFQVSGDINTLASTISYTPVTGKTAFLLEAKLTMNANTSAVSTVSTSSAITINDQIVADLKISSVTKSKAKIGVSSSAANSSSGGGNGSGFGSGGSSQFNVKGLTLVGDGIETIEIENVLDSSEGTAFAEMSGYLTDT